MVAIDVADVPISALKVIQLRRRFRFCLTEYGSTKGRLNCKRFAVPSFRRRLVGRIGDVRLSKEAVGPLG
jgi:hypothetical protein